MTTLIQILFAILLVALISSLLINRKSKIEDGKTAHQRNKGFRRTWRKIYLLPVGLHQLLGWMPGSAHAVRPMVEFANIGEGTYEHGIRSYQPDADTAARYLMYKRGTDADHCAVCGLNDDPLGPSDDQAQATGPKIAIKLLGAYKGTTRVVTDGTVNDGTYVKCGAAGQVTAAVTGDLSFGRALISTDATKAAGDVITIIPTLPSKLSF